RFRFVQIRKALWLRPHDLQRRRPADHCFGHRGRDNEKLSGLTISAGYPAHRGTADSGNAPAFQRVVPASEVWVFLKRSENTAGTHLSTTGLLSPECPAGWRRAENVCYLSCRAGIPIYPATILPNRPLRDTDSTTHPTTFGRIAS